MNLKSNQILIGVIILLIGIFALFTQYFNISYGYVPLLIVGGAFLLLYRTKRKSWPLIPGVIFLYIGLVRSLPFLAAHINVAAMFFIIPAIIFLILYYDMNKRGLLAPGMVLLWFGIYLIINGLPFAEFLPVALLPACMGVSFIMSYVSGKGSVNKWFLYIGAALCIIGGAYKMGAPVLNVVRGLPAAVSFVLIAGGVFIIIKTLRKKS